MTKTVTLDTVPMWAVGSGVGHIVISARDIWVTTACRQMTPNYAQQRERPVRICRKCRDALPELIDKRGR